MIQMIQRIANVAAIKAIDFVTASDKEDKDFWTVVDALENSEEVKQSFYSANVLFKDDKSECAQNTITEMLSEDFSWLFDFDFWELTGSYTESYEKIIALLAQKTLLAIFQATKYTAAEKLNNVHFQRMRQKAIHAVESINDLELFYLLDTVLYNVAGAIQTVQSERVPLWNFNELIVYATSQPDNFSKFYPNPDRLIRVAHHPETPPATAQMLQNLATIGNRHPLKGSAPLPADPAKSFYHSVIKGAIIACYSTIARESHYVRTRSTTGYASEMLGHVRHAMRDTASFKHLIEDYLEEFYD